MKVKMQIISAKVRFSRLISIIAGLEWRTIHSLSSFGDHLFLG